VPSTTGKSSDWLAASSVMVTYLLDTVNSCVDTDGLVLFFGTRRVGWGSRRRGRHVVLGLYHNLLKFTQYLFC
jgi:hypothetical protein